MAKRILQKCNGNYEEFLDGLARYRNIPRAATHKSPAELFFSRQLREPDLAQLPPMLDLSKNHEAVLAKKLQVAQKSQSRRELDPLEIGQRVLLQCPTSSTWREAGTVVAIDPAFERSYEIKPPESWRHIAIDYTGPIFTRKATEKKKYFPASALGPATSNLSIP